MGELVEGVSEVLEESCVGGESGVGGVSELDEAEVSSVALLRSPSDVNAEGLSTDPNESIVPLRQSINGLYRRSQLCPRTSGYGASKLVMKAVT